jgi:hypothetical protein
MNDWQRADEEGKWKTTFSEVLLRTDRTRSNMDERHKGQKDREQMELVRRLRDQWRHIATGHRSLDDRPTNTNVTIYWQLSQHITFCQKMLNVIFAMSDCRYYITPFRAYICAESERFADAIKMWQRHLKRWACGFLSNLRRLIVAVKQTGTVAWQSITHWLINIRVSIGNGWWPHHQLQRGNQIC